MYNLQGILYFSIFNVMGPTYATFCPFKCKWRNSHQLSILIQSRLCQFCVTVQSYCSLYEDDKAKSCILLYSRLITYPNLISQVEKGSTQSQLSFTLPIIKLPSQSHPTYDKCHQCNGRRSKTDRSRNVEIYTLTQFFFSIPKMGKMHRLSVQGLDVN